MLCALATWIGVFHVPCFISFHDMCYSYRPMYEWYAATCAAGELFIVFEYRILKASARQLFNWIYSSFRVTTSQRTNFNIWHKIWLWIQASNHLHTLYFDVMLEMKTTHQAETIIKYTFVFMTFQWNSFWYWIKSVKRCPIPSVLSEVSLLQTIINHLIPWRILTFSNLFD